MLYFLESQICHKGDGLLDGLVSWMWNGWHKREIGAFHFSPIPPTSSPSANPNFLTERPVKFFWQLIPCKFRPCKVGSPHKHSNRPELVHSTLSLV